MSSGLIGPGEKLKKKILLFVAAGGLLSLPLFYCLNCSDMPRLPASVPEKYDSLSACDKQEVLWEKARATAYKALPEHKSFGLMQLMGMGMQELKVKGERHSDFAPEGWKKYLHRRGSLAKVKLVSRDSLYTGVFQGADCGLLRLSLTYNPEGKRPVAPGLVLKILRDKIHSANISALVSLEGQGKEFNFFANPMSNIVPVSNGMGQKIVHQLFSRVSNYPEQLQANDMAQFSPQGDKIVNLNSPTQIFFVPNKELKFSSNEHDVRDDFYKIPAGTIIYHLYALPEKYKNMDYANYRMDMVKTFIQESEHVADIVSTSEFVASEFGDDGIFFKHQLKYK
jgi:hypothetical protein